MKVELILGLVFQYLTKKNDFHLLICLKTHKGIKMKLIDSHAHLTSPDMLVDSDDVIARAKNAGVDKIINICTDRPSMEKGLELAQKYQEIYNVGSTTPHDVDKLGEQDFPLFEKLAKENKLVAIGETGLDYYYEHSNREKQKEFLIRYLHLAKELNLPVVIHCRDAFSDLFAIADKEYSGKLVLHCFTGTLEEAKEVLNRGWMLSLSGIVTFKKCEELREVSKIVPLEKLLIETDSPYLAPGKFRGKRNEPSYITETAKLIAQVKDIDENDLAEKTYQNAVNFFEI